MTPESTPATQRETVEGLKPCPFCGVALAFKQPRIGDDYHEHPKNECVLAGDSFIADPLTFFDRPETRAQWNRRAYAERLASPAACPKCKQTDTGQTGEYACAACGLPTVWDGPAASPAAVVPPPGYAELRDSILTLAIAFTDAHDRGNAASDKLETGDCSGDEEAKLILESEAADDGYNKSKAALFAVVRRLTGVERTTRIQGWEAEVLAALAPIPQEVLYALRHADSYITHAPHGENCFVSAHYEGDPGNRCNCGKDSLAETLHAALLAHDPEYLQEAAAPVPSLSAAPVAQATKQGWGSSEFDANWLFEHCRIVFFPQDVGAYPIEHNPHALGYDKTGEAFKGYVRAALRATKGQP